MSWEIVIGLEVHTQLATKSKIFSGASTAFGAEPNTQACAIDLGLPGVLPVLNQEAVTLAVKFGLAVDAKIASRSVFARKNYFYPDLPKGYQISQYEHPIVGPGHLDITLASGEKKRIGITRAHLEEDAGKSVHDYFPNASAIDLNRAGTPLLEIVSEPDMRSAEEAVAYLKTLHQLVRYLGISDANMQEGSFRCDVNLSVRRAGEQAFGTRTEMKNLNSFRFIEKAIAYESERQIDIVSQGGTITQETRAYDPDKDITRTLRTKEDAHDYRYFPDPDLLPIVITDALIADIQKTLPELPQQKCDRYQNALGLSEYDAQKLSQNIAMADYFEAVLAKAPEAGAKLIANWLNGETSAALNKHDLTIEQCPVSTDTLATLMHRIADNTLSNTMAKQVFETLWTGETDVDTIIEQKGLKQITDESALEKIIDDIIANNPNQVEQYRAGKEKLFGFFVGQLMKATQGKANPAQANALLKKKLQ